MRYIIISCQVMQREVNYIASKSDNIITPVYLPQGLHNTPSILNQTLKQEIDIINNAKYDYMHQKPDAILLGYGLCANGIIGITAKNIPIVIPKTDDCIAIFLGSQKRYLDYFNSHNGIYWFTPGWIETSFMPSEENYKRQREEYTELYGEDNADFLMDETNGWHSKYNFATYIQSNIVDNENYRKYAKKSAEYLNWNFDEVSGDLKMLISLTSGNWNDEDFLIVKPNHTVAETFDQNKIKAVQAHG